jgi:hypothetical protein
MTGCLSNPATGVTSNGGPMRLKLESGTGRYTSNDVVAEDAIVDANGNDTGNRVQHTAEVTHQYQWSQWGYFQGRDKLDEQDYFRLAGDQQAADEVAHQRAKAVLMERLGLPIAVAGYIATFAMISYGRQHDNGAIENLGAYGMGSVAGLGSLLYAAGYYKLKNPHLLPQERAETAADLIQVCREGRCRTLRGEHHLQPSELRQLHVPFQRVSLGMR